jgi:hypothetical protein
MATQTKATQTQQAPVAYLHVIAQPKHRQPPKGGQNARALWWGTIQAHNGKTLAAWQAAVGTKVPSYQPKGKYGLAGKPEPSMGWLRHFVTNKFVVITNSATPPKA